MTECVWLADISAGHRVTSPHLFRVADARRSPPTDTALRCPHEWPTSADPTWPR